MRKVRKFAGDIKDDRGNLVSSFSFSVPTDASDHEIQYQAMMAALNRLNWGYDETSPVSQREQRH